MSAEIYELPHEYESAVPQIWDYRNDLKSYDEAVSRWKREVRDWVRKSFGAGKYIGEIINFPVADGTAEYMISSLEPVKLIHLPLMDAYEFPYADLMTKERVIEEVERLKRIEAFIAKHKAQQNKG